MRHVLPIGGFLLCAVGLSSGQTLVDPFRSGNLSVLERLGAERGAIGLAPEIDSPDRARALAAIHASLGAGDAWALLDTLGKAAAHPDRSIATAAAQVAPEIANRLDRSRIDEEEISLVGLRSTRQRWLQVASDPHRWLDIRVYALETAVQLLRFEDPGAKAMVDWSVFLGDDDPEMRAACIAFLPGGELQPSVLSILRNDKSEYVAVTAGQYLCGPLGSTQTPPPLDAPAISRLQTLATTKRLDVTARADLAPCLLAEGSVESRRALALLLQQSPPLLRRRLAALTRAE